MSDLGGQDPVNEIARGLSQSVIQALEPGAPARTLEGARELARMLSLPGLDRLLGVLGRHAGEAWPAPLRPVVERVQRAAADCGRVQHVEAFRRMDDELGLMARAIERVPLGRLSATAPAAAAPPPRPPAAAASVRLAEVLEGLAVERGQGDLLQRVRLRPPVGVALRAALDWLVGSGSARMRTWLVSDGSALEVTCERIAYPGIQPAADVLAGVGGHLGPAGERPGAWTVRVPIVAERETFLMLEQDELQLAVPWHAVVRVRLIPAHTIETMLRRQGLPVLPPLASAERRSPEQPVVVVALGLKRACLVADRLVWRMSGEPAPLPGAPPAEGITHAVRSDDGETYWVLEPAWLLRDVAAPPLADTGRGPAPADPPPVPTPRAPIPFPVRTGMTPSAQAPAAEALEQPEAEDREPIEKPSAAPMSDARDNDPPAGSSVAGPASGPLTVVGAPEAAPATQPPAAPASGEPAATPAPAAEPPDHPAPAAPRARAPRQALVAEDSITARIFLSRLLEQQGFLVHAVATAAELRRWLPRGRWALVCVDSELPDARGEELLVEMTGRAAAGGFPVVALVRDADDERAARAAGATATLRKPFERETLERMLAHLAPGLSAGPAGAGGDPREWGAR